MAQPQQVLPASIELPIVESQDVLNQMPVHQLREITRTTLQTKTHLLSYMAACDHKLNRLNTAMSAKVEEIERWKQIAKQAREIMRTNKTGIEVF